MKHSKRYVMTLVAGAISAVVTQNSAMAQQTFEGSFSQSLNNNATAAQHQLEERFIVKFKDSSAAVTQNVNGHAMLNAVNARRVVENAGAKVRLELPFARAMSVKLDANSKRKLKNHPDIEYMEPDYPRHLMAQNTPWGIPTVQADQVSDSNAGNMKVCIIDSGYDINNPDLSGNNHNGTNDSGTGNWYTPGGSHGTHVAGTIAAINNSEGVVGIMPNQAVNIHVVKVFNESGWGYSSSLTAAVNTCKNNGAKVVNMSLGGSGSSTTEGNAMQSAYDSGVLLIAAAGNDGNSTHSYPASYDAVVSVAALDETNQWAAFSQYTSQVELAAPGEAILSTVGVGDGRQGYITAGSTSYGDDRVVPHNRLTNNGSSWQAAPINSSATGTLASCSLSGSTYSCGNMSGKICIAERYGNQASGSYPETNPVKACKTAGAVAAIVYSNTSRPGLQNPFLLDQNNEFPIPSVSVNRTVGQALLAKVGTTVTVENKGNTDYSYYNGTSMATPHVTGVAALVWSQHPTCTAAQIRNVLKVTAQDLDATGRDDKTGYGLVRSKAAVDYITANGCDGNGNGGGGGTPTNALENGVAKTGLSASKGEELHYTLEVPAGATDLTFTIAGGTGDADLYVQFGSKPTTSSYECRPYKTGNSETCTISNIQAGTYYVMTRAYSSFSGVSLTGSFTESSSGGGSNGGSGSASNLSASKGTWKHYTVEIPAGMSTLNVNISGGSGDADLYVKQGSQPTSSSFDCRPYKGGNSESCSFNNPQAGTWHISIYAYSSYSGVNLNAEWKP
ncbi:S8 family serine peptidase [Aliikangiella sp. G2MR2-5]|uniref:S8 family serine peptidase n=1 Tax=Aliikangiella sp. G2MR2-5 TaxID=2788943 RepID=UPI0027389BE2|nr:S8 family serine peptidase [Aliikangiella sp. G2MR2-5]